ncbi:hypothetical protein BDZ89DRAFT_1030987 [Hymenopellis radicata]|nr:hypothetical protein BDZ89DRAFT_1030987 [Hymenopellis radicata]
MEAETAAEKARRSAVIPGLPKGRPAQAWRLAVKQWNEVDSATGYALKDWPESWYTGRSQTNMGNNRRNRELVALAFASLDSDEKRFEQEYPECNKSFAKLCNVIRKKECPGRTSRNGTPEERAQRTAATQ